MIFEPHLELQGQHAHFGASKYHWIRYSDEKLALSFEAALAAARGTELHQLAHDLIRLKEKLPRRKRTLNLYVNDCLGFGMKTEVVLAYSRNVFGTADAINYKPARADKRAVLRIFDYKSGRTAPSLDQNRIYAGIFCLEYGYKPADMDIDLRLYWQDQIIQELADPHEITKIMSKIIRADEIAEEQRKEAL